jgi:hypothetical protein
MQLSNYEKKRRKHEKELSSFKNKMGSNIVWFNSLPTKKQYDALFMWKKLNYNNKLTSPGYTKVPKRVPIDPTRPYGRKKVVKVKELKYPPSLKHFIKGIIQIPSYRPKVQRIRETTIDILLNKK